MSAKDTSNTIQKEEIEDSTTHDRLIEKLKNASLEFETYHHEAVKTSEEASFVRGLPLESGAKAIVLSLKNKQPRHSLFVMSAAKKLDSKKIRKIVGCKSVSFASPEEVKVLTGCITGAVPPFGSLWGIQTYMDVSLKQVGEFINFNSGLRTDSIRMKQIDYEKLEYPVLCQFTNDE